MVVMGLVLFVGLGGFSQAGFFALDGIWFAEPWFSALEGRLTFFCFAKRK
jgi:hypothetical protein